MTLKLLVSSWIQADVPLSRCHVPFFPSQYTNFHMRNLVRSWIHLTLSFTDTRNKVCFWFVEISPVATVKKDSFRSAMEALWFLDYDLDWGLKDLNLSFSFGKYFLALRRLHSSPQSFCSSLLPYRSRTAATLTFGPCFSWNFHALSHRW